MQDYPWQFESLVAELFRRNGLDAQPMRRFGIRKADLFIRSPKGVSAVVEMKLYRSRRVGTLTLKNVALLLDALRKDAQAEKAVLVITARLDTLARAELSAIPALVVYDFDRIVWMLANHPDLAQQFDSIIRSSGQFGNGRDDDVILQGSDEDKTPFELDQPTELPIDLPTEQPPRIGHALCVKFEELLAEQASASHQRRRGELAKEFELICIDALKYLFEEDLTSWHHQLSTEGRVSRFDLIARIRPKSDFWTLLVADFGTRYIVFEFKFYTEQIGQGEILTTEKYLYRSALRSTAIIISPLGANDNALELARGALREHGKLILNVTVNQLCTMLRAKDGTIGPGGPADVENELFEMLDDMLMRIER